MIYAITFVLAVHKNFNFRGRYDFLVNQICVAQMPKKTRLTMTFLCTLWNSIKLSFTWYPFHISTYTPLVGGNFIVIYTLQWNVYISLMDFFQNFSKYIKSSLNCKFILKEFIDVQILIKISLFALEIAII